MFRCSAVWLGAAALLCCAVAGPVMADIMVLDGDDVSDWARVLSTSSWKHRDACLHPNGLLKFDLDWKWPVLEILDAKLYLFVEKTEPGAAIELWHVQDDSWSYGQSDPEDLWNWPVWHSIGVIGFADTASFSMDVTQHLREELLARDATFSIKITAAGNPYPDIRISSPLAPIQRMRPRIVVEFVGPLATPPVPDLAVSTADLRLAPMRPAPGDSANLQAWVRNIGPGDAWNVPVSFSDGPPGLGQPIGTAVVPHLPAGGGTAAAAVSWTAVRGLRELYVTVDPQNTIGETDETNNSDFRSFLVADREAGTDVIENVESFEYPGLRAWHTDFDVPKQFTYPGPKSFYLNRSGAEAYHGDYSLEMFLDGTADDGTLWIESAVPVDPYRWVDVEVDFELFRYYADIAFQPVVAVSVLDPEVERDFTVLPVGPQVGWTLHSRDASLFTGPYDMVHVAVGLTVTWETPGTFYLDLVRTRAIPKTVAVDLPAATGARSTALLSNRPNPMGPLTTIAFRLAQASPISLRVFDTSGRLVATLREGTEREGFHEVHWNGTDDNGTAVPSGVYFYRLETPLEVERRKLLLVR